MRLVSWRLGRGAFGQWHLSAPLNRTQCGIRIPSGALVNFAERTPERPADTCATCWPIEKQERAAA